MNSNSCQVNLYNVKRFFFVWKSPCCSKGSSNRSKGSLIFPSKPPLSHLLYTCCCLVVADSVRPHRRQPTRLPRPWDSPGKNAGVGCHFLLHCMKVKSESEVAQSCPTRSNPIDGSPPGSSVHGIFLRKSAGAGGHCLLRLSFLFPLYS